MRILNLTEGAVLLSIGPTKDILIRSHEISTEFECNHATYRNLVMSTNYQNRYRFILSPDERSLPVLYPTLEGTIISMEEAESICNKLKGGVPESTPTPIDEDGKENKLPVPELHFEKVSIKQKVNKSVIDNKLINPENLPVKYSFDDKLIKQEESGRLLTKNKKGKTTVKAKFEGNDQWAPITASFEITITN